MATGWSIHDHHLQPEADHAIAAHVTHMGQGPFVRLSCSRCFTFIGLMTVSPRQYQDPVNVGLVDKNRNLNTIFIWIEWLDSQRLNPHTITITE